MAKRKPGKYDAVLQGLPALPQEDDPRRQAKIDALKEEVVHDSMCGYHRQNLPDECSCEAKPLKKKDAVQITKRYIVVRRQRDLLKAQESVLQLELDALVQLLIASEDEGTDPAWGAYGANDNAIVLPGGDTIRINQEPSSRVVDPDAFQQWCIANGYLRKLQLHAGTRDSIVAERLLAVEPTPDGLEVGSWTKLTFTAAKGE